MHEPINMIRTMKFMVISLLVLTLLHESNSFCDDVNLYACKELGITKCVYKTERCGFDVNCMEKPFPIEKPACKQNCTGGHSWCEQRGKCISQKEKCDCGANKIYCTTKGTYSCENRHGVDQSPIFKICPDGNCTGDCSQIVSNTKCHQGQFKCGGKCKGNKEIASFRDCEGNCISASDLCYLPESEVSLENTSLDIEFFLKVIVLILVALTLFFVFIFIKKTWYDLIKYRTLLQLEQELKNGYINKKLHLQQSNNEQEETPRTVEELDTNEYEHLMETIITSKKKVLKHLVKLPKPLRHEDIEVELLPKRDIRNLEKEVHKFVSGGCVSTIGNTQFNVTKGHKANRWLCDGDDKNQGCYCFICVIAGVSNEFTKDLGSPLTKANKKAHLSGSTQHSWTVAAKDKKLEHIPGSSQYLDIDSKSGSSGNITETNPDSHFSAEKIVNEVQKFSYEVIKSRSNFSLILYERKNVLAVILKAVRIIEKAEAQSLAGPKETNDICIPLGLLEVNPKTPALSLTEEIRKVLSIQKINLEQISSISSVHIDSVLPPISTAVCETFCQLPETQCICLYSILLTQQVIVKQGKFDDHHPLILHRVLNALTFVLSQSPQIYYDMLIKMQRENNEPIISYDLFSFLRHTSMKAIIHFVRSSPKSIRATLIQIQSQLNETNETDENKGRITGLLNAMDQFSTAATMLLQDIVFDAYEEVFSLLRDPYPKWDHVGETVKKQAKVLEKLAEKEDSSTVELNNTVQTYLKDYDCLKVDESCNDYVSTNQIYEGLEVGEYFIEQEDKESIYMKGKDSELKSLIKKAKETIKKNEIDLFIIFKHKYIHTAIKNLQSSFLKKSVKELHSLSVMLNTKRTLQIPIIQRKIYEDHIIILRNTFSKIKEYETTVEEIDGMKQSYSHMDLRTASSQLVANHSDSFPNLSFLAEIYLNLNLDSRKLQQLFLDIDRVVNITKPRLNLEDKVKKILVTTMRPILPPERRDRVEKEAIETIDISGRSQCSRFSSQMISS